ncbi:hypothetical protein OZZ08_10215 [Malaciobacter mytili]|uniref:hypothetical protein n=1 Tax=Malaciobacter mytili TaxID=603050 RepID=UPI003BAF3D7C
MKTIKTGHLSDFDFDGLKLAIAREGYKDGWTASSSGSQIFCLPENFGGVIEFSGGDLFGIGCYVEGFGNEEVGTFGITWNDLMDAFEAAGFVENDEEPMVESAWFNQVCEEFVSYVSSKII